MKITEFMLNLSNKLTEAGERCENTANAYIKTLCLLNNKEPFKNLAFLKKTSEIDRKISEYAESSQKTIYTSIASVLSFFKDKPTYKKAYNHYYEMMMGKARSMSEIDKAEKTTREKENWIEWNEVKEKQRQLTEEVDMFANLKSITENQFNTLLKLVVLSLYTETPPRRNQDYLDMYVGKATTDSKNYLDLSAKQFVFNKFKTSKTYGQQVIDIPEPLMKIIKIYLKHHPSKSKTDYKFLVYYDGSPMVIVNSITRILNKVFGKNIGSSMLRHIYLSSKYDIKEMEEDATAMGHSVSEQRNYLRE